MSKELQLKDRGKMQACENLLNKKGYTQAPWNKCPQGYKEADYRCFSHPDKNVWVELYPKEKHYDPYGMIQSDQHKKGTFFESMSELQKLLP